MTIFELANEYEEQYKKISMKMDGLKPLLYVYSGEDLLLLRRKLKIYYDMACECRRISSMLLHYYDTEEVQYD